MKEFRESKDISKRQKLIDSSIGIHRVCQLLHQLLARPFKKPHRDPEDHSHREFTRFIERFLHENWTYDKVVKKMMMAEGMVQKTKALVFT